MHFRRGRKDFSLHVPKVDGSLPCVVRERSLDFGKRVYGLYFMVFIKSFSEGNLDTGLTCPRQPWAVDGSSEGAQEKGAW